MRLSKKNYSLLHSFTLIEITITIGIIICVAVIALIALNPLAQINKAWDSKTKHDLNEIGKVLEDFYNDKNCYPKANEICYDPPSEPDSRGNYICHICGNESTPAEIKNYMSNLPCNPQYPEKTYLYQTNNNTCPSLFRIYTQLANEDDSTIKDTECYANSCGPSYPYIYNYGVHSPDVDLEKSRNFFCSAWNRTTGKFDCNNCMGYENCLEICETDNIYSSSYYCCSNNTPNSCGTSYYCWDASTNCLPCGSLVECQANSGCARFGGKFQYFKDAACTIK